MATRRVSYNQFEELIEQFQTPLQNALREAFDAIRSRASRRQVTEAIESNDPLSAFQDLEPEFYSRIKPVLDEVTQESGALLVFLVPAFASLTPYAFSLTEARTAESIQLYAESLSSLMAETVGNAIQASINLELTNAQNAIAALDSIGLNAVQARALINYETGLRNPTPGQAVLTDPEIAELVAARRTELINGRVQRISQDIVREAVNGGIYHAVLQLDQMGAVPSGSVMLFWEHVGDNLVRDSHTQIPGLNSTGILPGGTFLSPLGSIRYPHDPLATIANTINCRCQLRVVFTV